MDKVQKPSYSEPMNISLVFTSSRTLHVIKTEIIAKLEVADKVPCNSQYPLYVCVRMYI
jgi:hypothetical protein